LFVSATSIEPGAWIFADKRTVDGWSVLGRNIHDKRPEESVKGSNEFTETESIGSVALFNTLTDIFFP